MHSEQRNSRKNAITMEQAKAFMEEIFQMPSLELEQTANGCYQRCFLIRKLLEAKGVEHGHAHIMFNEEHEWVHHAAAWTILDTGEKVIFDPSEFNTPIEIEEWKHHWESGDAGIKAFSTTDVFDNKPPLMAILNRLNAYAQTAREQDLYIPTTINEIA